MKKLFIPFEVVSKGKERIIFWAWLGMMTAWWLATSFIGNKHLFPSIPQVTESISILYKSGLVEHIVSSLGLFLKSSIISIVISLIVAYSSTIPIFKPLASTISQFRYLPLTGISFYIAVLISDSRMVQVSILVLFMTTFLTTSLLSVVNDITEDEYNHARTMGCSRFEILYEVVIKGRLDYVIESIRQNLAIIWMTLVSVEAIVAASGGLGFLIKNSDKFGNHGRIISLQIIILIIGLIIDYLLTYLRKSLFRYSKF